ncbi:hypothetical protein SYK_02830 [Pseudodesulfovibrio nedwellii]|uniref:Uncharacterized protein n=1 Tax=Pseudodesulfovibrio nedwellii TaxID=2973072 RepID=A0ABM8AWM0_9BACT|nr:hypothetical protein [Pseudodesulfovibrio nedwellii]BDQ35923.1 hypothetical protein SYK_02830 [Pseudodesulfovibrio nedwellii]
MPGFDNDALTEPFLRAIMSAGSGNDELEKGFRALADCHRKDLVSVRDHDEMFRLQAAAEAMEDTADLFGGGAYEILKKLKEA